jgi:PIN domain nuclease of toxin-antitoxin system
VRLLLDTHIVLWSLSDDAKLRPEVRAAMTEAEALFVSAVSIWEIAVKRALGKLRAPQDLAEVLLRTGVRPLSVTWAHAAAVAELPPHHGDPFDRLLIAQAKGEGLTMVTEDRSFAPYDVPTLGRRTVDRPPR